MEYVNLLPNWVYWYGIVALAVVALFGLVYLLSAPARARREKRLQSYYEHQEQAGQRKGQPPREHLYHRLEQRERAEHHRLERLKKQRNWGGFVAELKRYDRRSGSLMHG